MNINSVSQATTAGIQEQASVTMLKKNLDFQQQAALQLLQSLPVVQDPAMGQHIDTTA